MAKDAQKKQGTVARTGRAGSGPATVEPAAEPWDRDSVWEMLAREVRLEPTEAEPIEMGYFKRLFSAFYDHLGSLLCLNLAVALQVAAGVAVGLVFGAVLFAYSILGILLAALVIVGVAGPAFAGMFNYARSMFADGESASLALYVSGMRRYGRRSWALLGMQVASGGILAVSIKFYSSTHSAAAFAAEMVILLLTVLWAMAGCYAWPLLVRDIGMRLVIRNAVALAFIAPGSTIVMLIGLLLLSALLIVIPIGGVLFLFAVWAVTQCASTTRVIRNVRERQAAFAGGDGSVDSQ